MSRTLTRFEKRRRRMPVHKRDLVNIRLGAQLHARLAELEHDFVSAAVAADPACADFLEWYGDEAKMYGLRIRDGVAALYWQWTEPRAGGHYELTQDRLDELRDELAEAHPTMLLDGEICTGRTIMQEFFWWSAVDWIVQQHLVEAIEEFRDYRDSGGMQDWRRKKRRRLAAARRRAIKEQQLSDARLSAEALGELARKRLKDDEVADSEDDE